MTTFIQVEFSTERIQPNTVCYRTYNFIVCYPEGGEPTDAEIDALLPYPIIHWDYKNKWQEESPRYGGLDHWYVKSTIEQAVEEWYEKKYSAVED